MARAEIEREIQQLEQQAQQLTQQIALLQHKLAKEPLSLETWVCWDVWEQQGFRLVKESFEGVVIDREFREDYECPRNSQWFYSVQTVDGQAHVGVDHWVLRVV
jgi:hypothetical protein